LDFFEEINKTSDEIYARELNTFLRHSVNNKLQRNEHNCNNLQTLIYINVARTVNRQWGPGWGAWLWQAKT